MATNQTQKVSSDAAEELRKAREAFGRWSDMKAEEFESATRRTLHAVGERLGELRERAANSDTAKTAVAELERYRDQLADRLEELKDASGEKIAQTRQAIADGANEVMRRAEKAWKSLVNG